VTSVRFEIQPIDLLCTCIHLSQKKQYGSNNLNYQVWCFRYVLKNLRKINKTHLEKMKFLLRVKTASVNHRGYHDVEKEVRGYDPSTSSTGLPQARSYPIAGPVSAG